VSTVPCEVLGRRATVPVPAELVFYPYQPRQGRSLFEADTNGLASGNSLDEATLHGLFEVMERDAISMNLAADRSAPVAEASLPEPFRSMAAPWRGLGVDLSVRSVPNAFGYACFEAFLREPGSDRLRLAEGSGLHVDRDIALARAVCEAAQSRATHIHGGREDVVGYYQPGADGRVERRMKSREQRAYERDDPVDYRSLPDAGKRSESIAALLGRVRARLREAGFPTVLRHRFALELDGLCVVKVVVPKLENVEHRPASIGPRLLDAIAGDA
jgi:ribosomal protein S12 methylthiotransferase accessory factor